MEYLCPGIMILAAAIALVTVVGHGIWVFVAWLFGRRSEAVSYARPAATQRCPNCGASLSPHAASCTVCHWTSAAAVQKGALDDLAATARQLDRFRQSGALDAGTHERLVQMIFATRQRLIAPPRAAPAAAPPVLLAPAPAPAAPLARPASQPAGDAADSMAELFPPLPRDRTGETPVVPAPPAERVRGVFARMATAERAEAAGEPPARARPPSLGQPQEFLPPRAPRAPFSQMLAAFMEEKNIRWGELVGGLLIVGCSIALVISLWSQIAQIPVLKFFIFTAATAALFGAGLYTEHRWKLQTTSRGVLIIATLLVPLNFLAIAAFSEGAAAIDPVTIGGEVVAIGLFLFLIYLSGRVIVPAWPPLLALGVLGPSVAQLLVRRFAVAEPQMGLPMLIGLGALPLVCYGASTGWMLRGARGSNEIGEREANAIFVLLGLVTFAALLPVGLLLYKAGHIAETLRHLAPLVSLGGAPALASGLLLWRRVTDPKLGGVRVAGTSIGVVGTLVMLAGIVLAWPDPASMLPVAALDFLVLTAVALLFEIPAAHLLAAPCLVLGYLVGFHAVRDVGWHAASPDQMLHALFSAPSGTALVPLVGVLAVASELFRRWRREPGTGDAPAGKPRELDATYYMIITGGVGLISLAFVTAYGFARPGDPGGASLVYAMYAVAAFWVAWHTQRAEASWAGSALALAALVQVLAYRIAEQPSVGQWHLAMMIHSSAAALAATLLRRAAQRLRAGSPESAFTLARGASEANTRVGASGLNAVARLRPLFADALSQSALASSLLAVPLMFFAAPDQTTATFATNAFWLAAVWMSVAMLHRLAELFTASQVALTLGVILAVAAALKRQAWFASSPHPWLDPWSLQAQGIALALLSLAWVGVRVGFRRLVADAADPSPPAPLPAARGEGREHQHAERDEQRAERDEQQPECSGSSLPLSPPAGRGVGSEGPTGSPPGWRDVAARLLYPPWVPFDWIVTAAVLIGLVALVAYGAMPGVAQELAPTSLMAQLAEHMQPGGAGESASQPAPRAPDAALWNIAGVPHEHGLGAGSWILLALVVLVLVAGLWERFDPWAVLGVLLAAAAVCPLVAGLWESDVAAASALRWAAAAFLAVGSIAIWCRNGLVRLAAPLGWPEMERRSSRLADDARTLALFLSVLPLAAMGLHVAIAAVARSPVDAAAATALGWCGIWFLVVGVLGLVFRLTSANRAGVIRWDASTMLLVLAAAPLVAMTMYVVAIALMRSPLVGPNPGSFFARIGNPASYALPLLVITLTMVGHAVRERSSRFAFVGGLMLKATVTAAFTLLIAKAGGKFGAVEWVRLGQLNAIAAAGFALAWIAAVVWSGRSQKEQALQPVDALLTTQVALGIAFNLLVIGPAALALFLAPGSPGRWVVEAGSGWGWLALALAALADVWLRGPALDRLRPRIVCGVVLVIGSLLAYSVCRWDSAISATGGYAWLGYHTLLVSVAAAGWLTLAAGWVALRAGWLGRGSSTEYSVPSTQFGAPAAVLPRDFQAPVARWVMVVGAITLLLALRAVDTDPHWPWWSAGAIVALSVLAAALARWTLSGGYLYLAGILFNLATTIWWLSEWWSARSLVGFLESLVELAEVNVVALAVPAIAWLMLELQVLRRARAGQPGLPAFHHLATIGSLVTMAGVVAIGLAADSSGTPTGPNAALGWLALACAAVLMTFCLWDAAAKYAVAGIYVSGLVAAGMTLDNFNLPGQTLAWVSVVAMAVYSVATSYLWSLRERLAGAAERLGIPRRREWPRVALRVALAEPVAPALAEPVAPALAEPVAPALAEPVAPALAEPVAPAPAWLLVANQSLAAAVVVLAYWIVLTRVDYPVRLLVAKAALAQALAVGLLAQGTRRTALQRVALALAVIGAVAWGWANLEPGRSGNLLNRAVVVMTAVGAMTALYAVGLTKLLRRETEWTRAARQLVPALVGVCAVSLMFILGTEVVSQMNVGRVEMAWPAIAAVAATLLGLSFTGLALAVLPGRDPLELSEKGRMAYVYTAEALLALLFMHIRLTKPEWFHGWFMRFWPLVVMAIAFLGVGLSELFRRQKQRVLSEPLERTGALLPVLPVLGFWMSTAGGIELLSFRVHFTFVLLSAGLLYGLLSITRRSFGFGVLAAVAVNCGWWYFLYHDQGFGLFQHAQLWLVPMSLSVLAAAYLNHDRLTEPQMTSVRYITLMTVYVSSTADIFATGVAESPWLPLVLAGLSVAGVMAGILLRVRAFLYLGSSFLVLSLVTMIRYAQVNFDWTWLWWFAGIVLGVLILVVFGLFEKKRDEMLRLVEDLKQWGR